MKRKWLWSAGIALMGALGALIAFQRMLEAPFYHVGDARQRPSFVHCRAEGDRWIVDEGIALYHFATGQGQDILVVHGGPGYPPERPWAVSAELAADFRLHYYHLRGCGKSSRPLAQAPEGNTYEKMQRAEACLGLAAQVHDIEQIRALLGKEKLILLGHSFGALIAALYAAEYPEHVQALIGVAPANLIRMPTPGPDLMTLIDRKLTGEQQQEYRQYLARYFDFGSLVQHSEAELSPFYNEFKRYYGWAAAPPKAPGQDGIESGSTGGWMTLAIFLSLGKRHDWSGPLKKVQAPTLVLHGEGDLTPVGESEDFAGGFSHGRLVIVAAAGHFLLDEQPEAAAKAIRSFLSNSER